MAVDKSYLPIQRALQEEYPEKYPLVCGPDGIVLTRSPWFRSTGIPLRLDGGERFEIEIGIFNPDGSSPHHPCDHTHVRYYTGAGDVLYIDPIYPLLWGSQGKPAEPIVEKYGEDEIDAALAEKYSLFPFSADLATRLDIDLWSDGSGIPPEPVKDYNDSRAAMHDSRAFQGIIVVDSGRVRDTRKFWGQRTTRVLRAVGGTALSD